MLESVIGTPVARPSTHRRAASKCRAVSPKESTTISAAVVAAYVEASAVTSRWTTGVVMAVVFVEVVSCLHFTSNTRADCTCAYLLPVRE